MKKLLFLALLAGCTGTSKENVTQKAVSDYLRKNLDDPTSYQPAHWGPTQVWRKVDAAQAAVDPARLKAYEDSLAITEESIGLQLATNLAKRTPSYASQVAEAKTSLQQAIATSAASHKQVDSLRAITDTARIGYLITHAFRAKNKLGALILDSARFEVDTKGQVKVWDSFKK